MTMTCKAVRVQLPSIDDPEVLTGPLAAHIGSCLRCQAEVARYRRLHRSLGSLAEHVEVAPNGLVADVESRLSDGDAVVDVSPQRVTRVAAAAGAVVAAAGTVAMVRWMRARSAA